jgi:hypothetical protein
LSHLPEAVGRRTIGLDERGLPKGNVV